MKLMLSVARQEEFAIVSFGAQQVVDTLAKSKFRYGQLLRLC